ncbi:MAG: hypothetical protein ACI8YQ_000580 [Polaribacter sp.]|jgi:hypothetical protein
MKKKNYNWNLNQDQPSKAQIDAHKDFDAVLNAYNESAPQTPGRAPTIRRMYYLAGAVAAALVGLFFFFGLSNGDKDNNTITNFKEYAATMPYVNPPLGEAAAAQFVSKSISANEGGVFEFENGSKLTVPPAAFTYGQGGVVRGEVQIRFREYHDFVDFFLSGIPMEYDSASVQYNLESAGMVEIIAEQDGKRLNMAPGKSIDVELVSYVKLENGEVPNFNIYYLDTLQRNWVYEGVDQIKRIDEEETSASAFLSEEDEIKAELQEELAKIEIKQTQQLAAIERSLPVLAEPNRPQRANGSDQVFGFTFEEDDIDYGTKVPGSNEEVLRLADEQIRSLRRQYANTMWQFSPKNTAVNKTAISQNTWDDMSLKFIGDQDYEMTLIGGDNSISFLVNPVLLGNDYDNALAEFNSQFSEYEKDLNERKSFMDGKLEEFKAIAAEDARIAQLAHEDKMTAYLEKGLNHRATDELLKAKIVNSFRATSLGTWNCDRPLPLATFALKGSFKGADGAEYHQNIAYLVNKNRNTVSRFYTRKGVRLDINIGTENLLWLVTNDNKIAIHPPENFNQLRGKKTSATDRFDHTFVMNLVDQPVATEEDIRKILDF